MPRALVLLIALLPLCGCSVVMAIQGQKEPNISVLEVGATRGQIELQLGAPVETAANKEGGSTDIYEYVTGDEPSPIRAVLHGLADVLTLCLWELVGTPIELVQGTKRTVQIEYDANDYAMSIRRISPTQREQMEQQKRERDQV